MAKMTPAQLEDLAGNEGGCRWRSRDTMMTELNDRVLWPTLMRFGLYGRSWSSVG